MRIRIDANIISNIGEPIYNNQIYSLILNLISDELSKKIHDEEYKTKTMKFFTFSNIYFDNDEQCHFYISGQDCFIEEIIKGIKTDSIVRCGSLILNVNNVSMCNSLVDKRCYLFKGNIIACHHINKKKFLIEDDELIEDRLNQIAKVKLDKLGVDGNVSIDIINKKIVSTKYKKNIKILAYNSTFLVKGNYEAVKTLYEIGFGENTATGNGLVWEV